MLELNYVVEKTLGVKGGRETKTFSFLWEFMTMRERERVGVAA